jgi:superfamily II DNA or RNA helicase
MINLYQDQQRVVDAARNKISQGHKNILIQACTGAGKSVMASYMIKSANQRGNRCAFVVPRTDLLEQMAKTFQNFELPYSYVASGEFYDPDSMNHICSMQTLVRRLDTIKPRIIFIDETHYGKGQLDKIIEFFKAHGAMVIGLSATPWKMDGKGLGCYYDTMVQGESIRWLIDNKRLSDYRLFGVSKPDLSMIKIVNGDYSPSQLRDKMENDRVLIGDAVKHYKEHAYGRLNLAYCSSIKHSKITADMFNAAGIPAAHMDGETPKHERRKIIRDYAERKLWVLTSVDLMCFGFDLASQVNMDVAVETMSDLRPTKSLALQMQKWGRVLRMKDEGALIFDHANNHETHGIPCMEREWTLADRKKKKRGEPEEGAEKTKRCPECFHLHYPAPHCPVCGHVYTAEELKPLETIDAELQEIKIQQEKRAKRREEGMCETLEDWEAIAEERGYKKGWARMRYQLRQKKARKS